MQADRMDRRCLGTAPKPRSFAAAARRKHAPANRIEAGSYPPGKTPPAGKFLYPRFRQRTDVAGRLGLRRLGRLGMLDLQEV